MKQFKFILLYIFFFSVAVYAVDPTGFRDVNVSSSVKIGGTGVANSSAALEINSITKGLLLPRMTAVQRNAISSPATGLMVFDTDFGLDMLWNGTNWQEAGVPTAPFASLGKFLQSGGGFVPNSWATPGPTSGGTGFTTWTLGDTLYSDATNSLAKLAGNTTATKKFLTQTGTGSVSAAPTWTQPACGDLSNSVASCSTDTTNASNISSGTLNAARLPNPSASTLGGIESIVSSAHKWINTISTSGVPALTQPDMSDLTGTATVAQGGTGQTSVVSAPAATAWAGWDANKNFSANNLVDGYLATTTAAGTTALTVSSAGQQFFVGSTTQTVTMPAVSTLVTGQQYIITNQSTGVVTVQSSGANTIQAMASNTQLVLTCISTVGTGTAAWSWVYSQLSAALPSTNPMTTGGDIIYGGSSGTPTRLANGSSGQVLQSNGTTLAPSWVTPSAGSSTFFTPVITGLSGSGTYNLAYAFLVSSANATAASTYTNNGFTCTTYATISAATILYMNCTGAPTSSGTLTKASGTGDSTITFSFSKAAQILHVKLQGGGGGGGPTGTAATGAATAGNSSTFGGVLTAAGGAVGVTGQTSVGTGGAGGTCSGANLLAISGNPGSSNNTGGAVNTMGPNGGAGGWGGGAGQGGARSGAGAAGTQGGGGGGAGGSGSLQTGGGGGGGAYCESIFVAPLSATYAFAIGASAAGGTGNGGGGGGAGGAGFGAVIALFQ